MNTKQLQLVTFEQAKRLKELGFDRVNNPCYEEDSKMPDHYPVLTRRLEKRVLYPAPAVALALKWMRDEKGIKNSVCLCKWSSTTDGSVRIVYQPCIDGKLRFEYNVYEAAESALLDELLTVLEGEKKQ